MLTNLHYSQTKQISYTYGPKTVHVQNRPSHINEDVIAQLPQVKMNISLDDQPTVAEVEKAIAAHSSGKVPGSDATPAETYKAGGTRLAIKIN